MGYGAGVIVDNLPSFFIMMMLMIDPIDIAACGRLARRSTSVVSGFPGPGPGPCPAAVGRRSIDRLILPMTQR